MTSFINDFSLSASSWQAFERLVSRLLIVEGFGYVSVVGQSGDGGADVLACKNGRRWLFQVKKWAAPVGSDVVDRTVAATRSYEAEVPVIVSKSGFTQDIRQLRSRLAAEGLNLQLWDHAALVRRGQRLAVEALRVRMPDRYVPRPYQEQAVQNIVAEFLRDSSGSALVVLATGLGKTWVAAEAVRRIALQRTRARVLVVAHTNDLVYQLERSFWPFLSADKLTAVVNGVERPPYSDLHRFDVVVASRDTLANAVASGVQLPQYDIVVVDECHHLGAETYEAVLNGLSVGTPSGPFLIGLTATPWRPGGGGLDHRFGDPVMTIDLVQGLNSGFLANVDYRMFTDNVDWDALRDLKGARFTPKSINRTLFINQWDDAVVQRTQEAWAELGEGARGIIFCGTVAHAETIAARVNALGFARAASIYSKSSAGVSMGPIERNRLLLDFSDGRIGILCAVDVLNEGVDVPDVNLVVFQRVTHSRRIFVQQLGRGLRLAAGKKRVLVLDFVSDVRRFAAGLDLQRGLAGDGPMPGKPMRVQLPSRVTFMRANGEDVAGATFLQQWLGDLRELEDADEDVSVLRFPPSEVPSKMPRSQA